MTPVDLGAQTDSDCNPEAGGASAFLDLGDTEPG